MTAREKSGRLTYPTAFNFARRKAKNDFELNVIYYAIGPRRTQLSAKARKEAKLQVPHLGDWQLLRAKAYFFDKESLETMRKTVHEKLDGLEAGRGAATLVLELLAKWMKYDDKLDEVFDSTPVLEGLSPTKQEKRADLFFKLKRKTLEGSLELVDKYLACHGITTNGLNDLGSLVMAVSNSAAKNVLAGAAAGAVLQSVPASPALIALTQAIQDKARIFSMPMPGELTDGKEEREG
jgi:hypothetical protein